MNEWCNALSGAWELRHHWICLSQLLLSKRSAKDTKIGRWIVQNWSNIDLLRHCFILAHPPIYLFRFGLYSRVRSQPTARYWQTLKHHWRAERIGLLSYQTIRCSWRDWMIWRHQPKDFLLYFDTVIVSPQEKGHSWWVLQGLSILHGPPNVRKIPYREHHNPASCRIEESSSPRGLSRCSSYLRLQLS